jgi:hypothetical protein
MVAADSVAVSRIDRISPFAPQDFKHPLGARDTFFTAADACGAMQFSRGAGDTDAGTG